MSTTTLTEAQANLKRLYDAHSQMYDQIEQAENEIRRAIASEVWAQYPGFFTTWDSDTESLCHQGGVRLRIMDLAGSPTFQANAARCLSVGLRPTAQEALASLYVELTDRRASLSRQLEEIDQGRELLRSIEPQIADLAATLPDPTYKYAEKMRADFEEDDGA